ncbi:MAG TPA: biotin/lipoyl-containing protein [Candidatus Binataceae bacterium]|jgi:biotin carboxyl carrier protein|nr:biotin/lipoyl-containing protein [Candidatus Binataceae bacterium]
MKFVLASSNREYEVEIIDRDGSTVRARIDGAEVVARMETTALGRVVRLDGETFRVFDAAQRDSLAVAVGPAHFTFKTAAGVRRRAHASGALQVTAPMPGKVLKVLVVEGQVVAAGVPLITLEAMKMETTLCAEGAAVVAKIHVAPETKVDHGAVLIDLGPAPSPTGSN